MNIFNKSKRLFKAKTNKLFQQIVQNGANSAVGQAVIQIAKSMKVVTVNVVRDRDNVEELKQVRQEVSNLIPVVAEYCNLKEN